MVSIFLDAVFSSTDDENPQFNLEEKHNLAIKDRPVTFYINSTKFK